MNFKDRLQQDFSTMTLVLIPVAIVLNIVVGQIASSLSLPIFLDSIGTVLIALLAGPWVGALTGLLTNLIWGLISDPITAAFAPVAMVIGLVAGLLARAGLFRQWWQAHQRGDYCHCPLVCGGANSGVHVWRRHRQRGRLCNGLPAGRRARSVQFGDYHGDQL